METRRPIEILVVEDEKITARAMEQSLKNVGYDVIGIASSRALGQHKLKRRRWC